jgi:glycosyltransferase involved in cell wall biosynthesis
VIRHSIVIPAYNEAKSIPELYDRVAAVLNGLEGDSEIVFVDDGSTDGTPAAMQAIADRDPRVKVIRFPRNAGKSNGYSAAFGVVEGDYVFTLDADLQDEPAEIPKLKAKLDEGFDLVVGWKHGRFKNEPHKRVPSAVFNALLGWSFGLHLVDSNSGIRGMRRDVARSFVLYGDLYRFIPQLAHVQGYRVTEQPVLHHPRKYDKSKYGPKRFWTGLLDLLTVRFLTRWRDKPLHFFGTVGLLPVALGFGLELWALAAKLILGSTFQEHVAAIVIGVSLILLGFQLVGIGLIGELVTTQLHHMRRRDPEATGAVTRATTREIASVR